MRLLKRGLSIVLAGVLVVSSAYSVKLQAASYEETEGTGSVYVSETEENELQGSYYADGESILIEDVSEGEEEAEVSETEMSAEISEEESSEDEEEPSESEAEVSEETENEAETAEISEAEFEDFETSEEAWEISEGEEEISIEEEFVIEEEFSEEPETEEEAAVSSAEETEEYKLPEEVSPAFSYAKETEGYQVRLTAETGVFPKGTEVTIEKINRLGSEDLLIESIVRDRLPESLMIVKFAAFAITFMADGTLVEPEKDAAEISIILSEEMVEMYLLAPGAAIKTFRIDDAEMVEEVECYYKDAVLSFEAASSSCYAVMVTGDSVEAHDYADYRDYALDSTDGIYGEDNLLLDTASSSDSRYIIPNLEPTRDQNPYGSCWAFAAVSSLETYLDKNYGNKTRDLSELQLAYSAYHNKYDPLDGITNDTITGSTSYFLDNGGNYEISARTLMAWQGPVNESSAPYGNAASIISSNSLSNTIIKKAACRVTDVYYVDPTSDRSAVKKLLIKNGSVGISYYSNEIYYCSTYNSFYTPYSIGRTNHAVSIVGWDDDFSRYNFNKTAPGNGAWYIRNSWSASNGQSYYAYFWLSYYDGSIGSLAASYKVTSASTYDNNYQYDGAILSYSVGWYYTGITTISNIFTAKANTSGESLKAVSFYTEDVGVTYTIKIYTDLTDSSNPESGTLVSAATTTGSRTYAGYHTITLKNPVNLSYGKQFSVVVALKKANGNGASFGVEASYNGYGSINVNCSAKSGQSFIKTYGSWSDYGASKQSNICIKAYTVNKEIPNITYSINFSANGGTGTTASMTGLNSRKSYTLTANGFKRSLYIFNGWNTKKDGSGKSYSDKASVTALTTTDGAAVTLYAQWTKTCKITYALNGGTNNSQNVSSFTIKSEGTISLYSPTRTGYTFKGWYTSENFLTGTKVTCLNKNTDSHYKVYAKWSPVTYNLKLAANNGSGDVITYKSIKYTEKVTLSANLFTRKGYTLVGWSTSTSLSGVCYYPDEVCSELASGGTKTLYAVWTKTSNTAIKCPSLTLTWYGKLSWMSFYRVNGYNGNLNIKVFNPDVVRAYQDSYWGQYGGDSNRRDVNFSALKEGRSLIKITNDKNSSAIYFLYVYTGADTYVLDITNDTKALELMKEEAMKK